MDGMNFMNYRTLKSLWHENKEKYQIEKDHRSNSLETIQLPLAIHGQSSFYVPDINAIHLIETINKKETKIANLYNALPDAAKDLYAMSCLIDEIHYTNDIEGVRSTRQEIKKAYDLLQDTGKVDEQTRFSSIVNKYAKFKTFLCLQRKTSEHYMMRLFCRKLIKLTTRMGNCFA